MSQSKKLVIIINGKGGVGKDALCEALGKKHRVLNVSSITPIKEIAAHYGWRGEKDERSRRFLAELKRVFSEYNDLPNKYLMQQYEAFLAGDDEIMCAHIREREQIERFAAGVRTKCIRLLVRRAGPDAASLGNSADDNVSEGVYDYTFCNDAPLEESSRAFCELVEGILASMN